MPTPPRPMSIVLPERKIVRSAPSSDATMELLGPAIKHLLSQMHGATGEMAWDAQGGMPDGRHLTVRLTVAVKDGP